MKSQNQILSELNDIENLIKHLIAIQLYNGGASQDEICKNLKMSKTTVVSLLAGIKKKRIDEKT